MSLNKRKVKKLHCYNERNTELELKFELTLFMGRR